MRTKYAFLAAVTVAVLFFGLAAECSAQWMWVPLDQVDTRPGFTRVYAGRLTNGTDLPVCRGSLVVKGYPSPGKYYNKLCLISYGGKEYGANNNVEMLLSKSTPHWKLVTDLTKRQIEQSAIPGGEGAGTGREYVCRKQMQDGVHPGKYAVSNGMCYVGWGGKEMYWNDGFEILFP